MGIIVEVVTWRFSSVVDCVVALLPSSRSSSPVEQCGVSLPWTSHSSQRKIEILLDDMNFYHLKSTSPLNEAYWGTGS